MRVLSIANTAKTFGKRLGGNIQRDFSSLGGWTLSIATESAEGAFPEFCEQGAEVGFSGEGWVDFAYVRHLPSPALSLGEREATFTVLMTV